MSSRNEVCASRKMLTNSKKPTVGIFRKIKNQKWLGYVHKSGSKLWHSFETSGSCVSHFYNYNNRLHTDKNSSQSSKGFWNFSSIPKKITKQIKINEKLNIRLKS